MLGRIDEKRDQVLVDRDAHGAARAGAVVGGDYEQRIVEPGALSGLREKTPDRIVAVLDRALAPGPGRNVDAPWRIRIGTVVARGHHVHERRPSARVLAVDLVEHLVEQVLVGDAPNVLELDARRGNRA